MSPRPGVELIERDAPPSRTAPTDTGTAFVTGETYKGPQSAVLIQSMQDFEDDFGKRTEYTSTAYDTLYNVLDAAFREGLARCYVSRVLGPAPVSATVNLFDASGSVVPGDVSLIATAKTPGDWGNALNVEVQVDGTNFRILTSHDTDTSVSEDSGLLADRAAAVAWSVNSDYITLTEGASAEDPRVVAATSLTTGATDRTNITETQWTTALTKFPKSLGPGQVAAPGRSTSAAQTALLAHAKANNRIAILDTADSTSKSTLLAAATALRSLADARYGGLFAPWVKAPGLVAASTRTIPASAYVLGQCARNDAENDPGEAVAGDNGRLVFVDDLRITVGDLTDSDYKDLNDGAVNMIRYDIAENPEIYGFRTLVDKEDFPNHWRLSDMRALMAIRTNAEVISESFVFKQFDGRGRQLASYKNELDGMLLGYYTDDMLYGATPEEAFFVDVGPGVNPVADLENGIVKAAVSVRVSPFAELIQFILTKRPITEAVS